MTKRILISCVVVLSTKPLRAETCFSYEVKAEVDSSTNVEALRKMQGNLPQSPAMKKMMADLEKSNRPQVTKNYMSSRYMVAAFPEGYSTFDYQKGSSLNVMHAQKMFVAGTMTSFDEISGSAMKPSGFGSNPFKASTKVSKKTGKSLTIAGLRCDEYETTTSTQVSGQYVPGGKNIMVDHKTVSCEAANEPALYFKLKKSHETLFLSSLPAGIKVKMQAIANARKENERWALSEESSIGQGAPMAAAQGLGSPKGRRIVQNIGNECPPAKYLQAPVGYKDMKVQLPRLGK